MQLVKAWQVFYWDGIDEDQYVLVDVVLDEPTDECLKRIADDNGLDVNELQVCESSTCL